MSDSFDDIEFEGIDDIANSADVETATPTTTPSPTPTLEKKKSGKKAKTKVDKPTPKEINTMSNKEINDNMDKVAGDDIKSLYDEFNGILNTNEDMSSAPDVLETIPTGIKLMDANLGGGFAVGKLNIVVGQPGCGKSMIAMQAAGRAQKKFKNCMVMYLDAEESTTTQRLYDLGVRNPEISPYGEMSVEKVFRVIESLCVFKEEKGIDTPSVIVWDSIANTQSEKELTITDPNQTIGYKARVLTQLLPQYVQKCTKYNICLLAVNQLRDVIAMGPYAPARDLKMMSAHKDMPGGNSLKFNTFQLIEMKTRSVLDQSKYGFDGILVRGKCVKNKLFRPNIEFDIIGNFTRGFSNFFTSYAFLAEHKRLKTGAWNFLVNYPETKFRTKDALITYRDNKVFREAFDKEVDDCINVEITQKYASVESDLLD